MNRLASVASVILACIFFLGLPSALKAQGDIDPAFGNTEQKIDPMFGNTEKKVDPMLMPTKATIDSTRFFIVGTETFSVKTVQNPGCFGPGFETDHVYLNGTELKLDYHTKTSSGSPCSVINIYIKDSWLIIETEEILIEEKTYLNFYEKENGVYTFRYSKRK